jgi:hypothetical protein
MKNVLAKTYKIKLIQYSKYKPSCSMVFIHFSANSLMPGTTTLYLWKQKYLQPRLPRPLQIEIFTTKELGHRTKEDSSLMAKDQG